MGVRGNSENGFGGQLSIFNKKTGKIGCIEPIISKWQNYFIFHVDIGRNIDGLQLLSYLLVLFYWLLYMRFGHL